jgi:hypothetical protein
LSLKLLNERFDLKAVVKPAAVTCQSAGAIRINGKGPRVIHGSELMVLQVTFEVVLSLVALAVAVGSGLFWLGHLRADVERAKADISLMQREIVALRLEVGTLAQQGSEVPAMRRDLKAVTDDEA